MMKYFHLTAEGTATGPETLEVLCGMIGSGAVHPGTLVVPAGGADWTPLARVLRFFYGDDKGATIGPVAFRELNGLHQIAALPAETWVMEEGGSEWKPLANEVRCTRSVRLQVPLQVSGIGWSSAKIAQFFAALSFSSR